MKKNVVKNFEEIVESRSITEETKKIISRRIISNFAFGVSFIILILAYRLSSFSISNNIAEIIYSISSLVFILLTIITFEVGYKKDDGKFAITGIELLVFSLLSLFSPYIFHIFNYKYITAILCIGTLYYIIKIITIYNKEINKAFKENNDISVIIKKESQDKLAKKFGKVKNDEIKTVITSEKPKKTQTKKTTSKNTKTKTNSQPKSKGVSKSKKEKTIEIVTSTQEDNSASLEDGKNETKKDNTEVKNKTAKSATETTKTRTTKPKTTSTKSNPIKKTTEKKTTAKKTTNKSTTSKNKNTKSQNTTNAKSAQKTVKKNTAKTTNTAKKTNTAKSKTTSKKEKNE